jgi:hypothetical protein
MIVASPEPIAAVEPGSWRREAAPGGGRGVGDGHCWPSPAQELLLAAALIEGPRGRAAWAELRATLDVDTIDYASHAVLPLLYRQLKDAGIDDPLLGIFKGIHRYNWARNQALIEAFVPILRQLHDGGIPIALLKGAALMATTYADPGLRAMADVDVLVPTAARRAAIDILAAAGLIPVSGFSPDAVDHAAPSFTPSYAFRDRQNHELDLHWQVLHHSRQPDADDEFWAAMRDAECRGLRVKVLDPADQLLHVIAHGLRWNQVPPLRWVIDAVLILRQPETGLDVMRLVEQAQRRCLVVPVRQALEYLKQRFDAPVPDAAIATLRRSPTSFLERWETRIETSDPAGHRAIDRMLLEFQDATRRRTPLGKRPGWGIRLAALAACRGLDARRQLPADLLLGRPGLPHHPRAGPTAVIAEGGRLQATRAAGFYRLAGHGWSMPESHGTWSIRRRAQIRLVVTDRSGLPLALSFAGHAFVGEGWNDQSLVVAINGRRLARWRCRPGAPGLVPARVVIPPAVAAAGILDLRFCVARLGSPYELGIGDDVRRLGFVVSWLSVAPLPALRLGQRLDLGDGAMAELFLADGWKRTPRGAELDSAGRLVLRLATTAPRPLRLTAMLGAIPGAPTPDHVALVINRRPIARWSPPGHGDGAVACSAVLPTRLLGTDSAMTIELCLARDRRDAGFDRPALCLAALVIDAA